MGRLLRIESWAKERTGHSGWAGPESIAIPLTQTTKYLGAQIAYGDFETATLKHRLKIGRARYWQLASILNSRRSLSLGHRIAMWRCVIWPTLSYGLVSSGLSLANLKLLQSTIMKQLRAISNSPCHITRETDKDLLARLDVTHPCIALSQHRKNTISTGADPYVFPAAHEWQVHLRDCFDNRWSKVLWRFRVPHAVYIFLQCAP